MPDNTNAVVKVFKYIGAVVGTTLAMITLLAFFFAPIQAKLDTISTKQIQIIETQNEYIQKYADLKSQIDSHELAGHEETDQILGEVRDQMIEMNGTLTRATADINNIQNRQTTQINQVSDLRAEVGVMKRQLDEK